MTISQHRLGSLGRGVLGPACVAFFSYEELKGGWQSWEVIAFVVVAAAVSLLLLLLPRNSWRGLFEKHFGWLPAFLGALSWPYWQYYAHLPGGPPVADIGFYNTAAQVLPVLLLAAVVDVGRSRTLQSHMLAVPVLIVFIGEIAALDHSAWGAEASGGTAVADYATVCAALVTAVIALLLAVLADAGRSGSDSSHD